MENRKINDIEIVSVYSKDSWDPKPQKNIRSYIDKGNLFKYVLFRAERKSNFRFLRLSPQKEYPEGLEGDTHLTIIGKVINEFKRKRNLNIDEIEFRQDAGHGVLWLINESMERNDSMHIRAECGAFMKLENQVISFYGESQALRGGQVFNAEEHIEHSLLTQRDKINLLYSIPAKIIQEELNDGSYSIYVPNVKGQNIKFNLEELTQKFS